MSASEVRRVSTTREGTIKRSGRPFECCVRFLNENDVDRIYELQSTILAAASRPLPLYVRDRDFFEACVRERGCTVGALDGDHLVAYAILYVPREDEDDYGAAVGLRGPELTHVGHLAGSGVHPDYRGNGLQSCLVDLRGSFAMNAGYYHLLGEVLPANVISIRNHLQNGYFLKGFKVDRFELSVYILHNDMRVEPELIDPASTAEGSVHDVATYRRMIAGGAWGFRLTDRAGIPHITYGKFVQS
ncbi:MAG: GNAT family N-acetyltransferase [Gemmatimonadales bacterium]